ncbi:ABC transporter permease subunit [Pseudobacter ginsenosidimutans]|uniref:ABC-2 type transport system permease protein n=1 Tax=Pseudobacter ginsenosidimutans TaxID=661488 RepID=A0A4Q7MZK9_9BACT|nr:Gldg family protein [Pseudobacter ginsenosidimutans]QEC43355.1 ABC transporter permease subunit [Pseudobacter ginsenosidimutans]RZS74721.1 ABC-2 type transport system permease protein [Pseudobacter ginsenosidimutans]
MKLILKIAKNEWRYLFYSPIAWFIMLVFLVQCAVYYTGSLYEIANWQELMLKNSPGYKGATGSLTFFLFLRSGIFINVIQNLYLFIPLLTMGLISREFNNGTIKLLYSSPVKLQQIVLGKYLGIMLYSLVLVLLLGIFVVSGIFNIEHADIGRLLSAMLGFYLMTGAYAAIGLFLSALTTYQIVSAFSTFIILFILGRIGGLWQKYDIIRDLTWFLSLQNRTSRMMGGLITTRDLFYFILVASLFISFTMIRLKAGREARPWYVRAGRYLAVLTLCLTVGYVSSRPTLTVYWDTTAAQANTIPAEMQELIRATGDSTLEVTLYTNLLGPGRDQGLPENRNAIYLAGFWEPYLRFKPDIRFKYEYYYDVDAATNDSLIYRQNPGKTLAEIAAESADLIDADFSKYRSPEEMRKIINLQPESYRLVMRLTYKGRTEFLRTFEDPFFWPDLNNVSAVFKRLLEPEAPKIYFVNGHLERSIYKTGEREYAVHTALKGSRGALVNLGFDADTIDLESQDLPAHTTALVLADPKTPLSKVVQNKITSWIDAGGNFLAIGKPGKQDILNPVLQQLGVQLMTGQLVEPTFDETPDKVRPYITAAGSKLSPDLWWIKQSLENRKDTLRLLMPGVAALSFDKDSNAFHKQALTQTDHNRSWLKAGQLVIDSTLPAFDNLAGDRKEISFITTAMLTRQIRNKEQRIIISGDADFASNGRLGANYFMVLPIYSWMDYNRHPIHMTRTEPKDIWLNTSEAGASAISTIYVWILPVLLLLTATILLIRRKRK